MSTASAVVPAALPIQSWRVDPFPEAVEAYMANLRTRGKKPSTIKAYRQLFTSAAPVLGWSTTADIAADSLMEWIEAKRESGDWKGVTLNRNLTAFQGLTRFLRKKKWLSADPLEELDRAQDDGGDGARAASTDEARRLIRFAWERTDLDRRCKGNRALVWHCMFAMALRASEPACFRWRCLFLEESVPFIRWTREMQKNHKPQEVALAPEVAQLLLAHRASVPHGPDDLVFPVQPPRVTFRKDRDGAGIPAADRRGKGFSPHSARKWFSHTLTVAGVEGRIIDTLMRHATGTPGRYPDLLVEDQAPVVALLPRLWISARDDEQNVQNDLTLGQSMGDTAHAKSMQTTQVNSDQRARPGDHASTSQLGAPTWRTRCPEQTQPSGCTFNPPDLSENAECRIDQVDTKDRQLFGDLLAEGVARMLQKGASGRGRST